MFLRSSLTSQCVLQIFLKTMNNTFYHHFQHKHCERYEANTIQIQLSNLNKHIYVTYHIYDTSENTQLQ